jgi:hypothetical protein
MIVPHDVEKGFIGLQNPAVEIPDEDADDVGVDQTPNLRFALAQCLLGPLALRYVDMATDNLDKVPARGEEMMARRFEMFDCSIRQYDSRPDGVVPFLA